MSCSRYCYIYKANNDKWYLDLGDFEYAEYEDSTTYGPFKDHDEAHEELENHSNPGAYMTDDSGKSDPPTRSPNGKPIQKPYWSRNIRRW